MYSSAIIRLFLIVATLSLGVRPACAATSQDPQDPLKRALAMLPQDFDSLEADAKKAVIDDMSAGDRTKVVALLHQAYTQNASNPTSYPQAGQALLYLQDVDPAQRLQCLRDLEGLVRKLYAANPRTNIGYGKQLAATRWAIAQELWTNLSQDEQAGKITTAPQMRTRLTEISTAYEVALGLCRELMLAVGPYSQGNSQLTEFVTKTRDMRDTMLTSRKPIDDALKIVNRGTWRPLHVAPEKPPVVATKPPAKDSEHASPPPAPAEPQPTLPPEPQVARAPVTPPPPPQPAEEPRATVPPPPPDTHAPRDIFDFGREGL